ncbi:MAG: isocitrate lyase/phosphoenolpyruvate mutase family protein [Pseudomonadota bacterium]
MTQADKLRQFADLHQSGAPVLLYNIWDAGGARALEKAGASAIATGSWSVAAAHGYGDGQAISLDFVLQIVGRIAASTSLPLSVDFEGAYAEDPAGVTENARRLIQAGAIGVNFEDQIVGGDGLHAPEIQARRIEALRKAGEAEGVALFVNARTDLFLKEKDASAHAGLLDPALDRARIYAEAGANGFFVPGLTDMDLIRQICEGAGLPVNAMMIGPLNSVAEVAGAGVARISFGPAPYALAMKDLAAQFATHREALS